MRLNRARVIAGRRCVFGVVGPFRSFCRLAGSEKVGVLVEAVWEGVTVEGESPVDENDRPPDVFPSSTEPVKFRVNLAGPPAKPKYSLVTDSGQVP
jgi:hypothetical protein